MKKAFLFLLVAALATFTLAAPAQETAKTAAAPKAQTVCPVSGHPIDKAHYVDYQGQRIYFCCGNCPAKFKADPEKSFEKIAKEGVVLESVQASCPVSGEKLEDKDNYVDYKGRRVYFCCGKCPAEFKKDPAKYLAKLPGEQAGGQTAAAPAKTAAAATAAKTVYVCTMCNVTSDKPGKCSKCGMTLVAKTST